jgi:signal transduction histidine kinase
LVDRAVDSGIPTELILAGEQQGLDTGLQEFVYRIVQEALTNVRKHAPGAQACVAVLYTARGVEVEVTNTASPGGGTSSSLLGAGHGLIGIGERVALYGGSAESGRTADGGFRVHASLVNEPAVV